METLTVTKRDYTLSNQLSILMAVFLLTAVASRLMDFPPYWLQLGNVLGSPFILTITKSWLLAVSLSLLTLSGTYALVRQHPNWDARVTGWWVRLIPPTLSAMTLSLMLSQTQSWVIWLRALLLSALITGGLVYLTYEAFVAGPARAAALRLIFNIVDYALAFVLLQGLMRDAGRGLVLVPVTAMVQGLLALDMLSTGAMTRRTLLYAALTAVAAGELAWSLSYWPISPRVAGIWLTLSLYAVAGLGSVALTGQLNRRAVWEFLGLVLLVGVAALLFA